MVYRVKNNNTNQVYYFPDIETANAYISRNDFLEEYRAGIIVITAVDDLELIRMIAADLISVCRRLTLSYQIVLDDKECQLKLKNKLTVVVRLRKMPIIFGNVTDPKVALDIAEIFHKRRFQVNLIYSFILKRNNTQTILKNLITHEFNIRPNQSGKTIWNNFKRYLYLFKRRCIGAFRRNSQSSSKVHFD